MADVEHTIKTNRLMNNEGGAFLARNMMKSPPGGVEAGLGLTQKFTQSAGTVTASLDLLESFVERDINRQVEAWGRDSNGDLYLMNDTVGDIFRAMDYGGASTSPDDLAIDANNEIVYTGKRYMGATVTDSLNGNVAQGDTTITVNDTTGFPSSGYALITPDNNPGSSSTEVISYTGISSNDLTGVTRGVHNTTDQSHNDGDTVVAFDYDYKDFGSSQSIPRPCYRWEDTVLLGNGRYVATWDGSTFTTQALDLPKNYEIVDFSELPTSSGSLIIIAANYGSKGELFIWDGSSKTWKNRIEVKESIQALYKTYIGTARGIYETDGYILKLVSTLPQDNRIRGDNFDIQDIDGAKGQYLFVSHEGGTFGRNIGGLWILDLKTGDWTVACTEKYGHYNSNWGGIMTSSRFGWTFVANNYNGGSLFLLGGAQSRGSAYQVIYDPQTSKILQLSGINLDIDNNMRSYNNSDYDFDVVVRYYDYRAPFSAYAQLSSASTSADEIIVGDSLATPRVGDRVEIIQRDDSGEADVAYAPRNITAVSGPTGGEYTITVDDDLPATIGSTLASQYVFVQINPLVEARKISVSGHKIDPEDFMLSVPDRPRFRKLLIEVEFRLRTGHPRLNSIEVKSNIWQR